jgi:hypothetical protein
MWWKGRQSNGYHKSKYGTEGRALEHYRVLVSRLLGLCNVRSEGGLNRELVDIPRYINSLRVTMGSTL